VNVRTASNEQKNKKLELFFGDILKVTDDKAGSVNQILGSVPKWHGSGILKIRPIQDLIFFLKNIFMVYFDQ
jgi:hypothetical protein